jgi:hypothetical protein
VKALLKQTRDMERAFGRTDHMIGAIYARKSTEQTGAAEDAKSVTRPTSTPERTWATKGWTVGEAHVYVDDEISGAEFAKWPGLVRPINALTARPTGDGDPITSSRYVVLGCSR